MCKSSGDFWNKMPLHIQKEILEEYYPIGMKLVYYVPAVGDTRPPLDYGLASQAAKWSKMPTSTMGGEIVGYEVHNSIDSSKFETISWYILRVKNNEEARNLKGKEYEDMHVGFFMPDPQWVRINKLKELGI